MLVDYDGAFVVGTGIPSGVLRFAGHVVLGIYTSLASTAYNYVKDHAAIVQQPPFHPNTFYLSHLASKWSKIGFWWNFAMWIPTMLAPSLYVTLIGLFDAVIMVYFAIATVRQATYIPHSLGPCRIAETWQVPMNGNESYFHVLETLHTYPDDPDMNVPSDKICKDFVSQWRFGIGSLVIYILVSFFNIIVSFALSIVGVRSRMTPERKRKEAFVLSAIKVIFFMAYSFGGTLFLAFWSALDLLPNSVLSRCRFSARYMNKMSQFVAIPIQDRLQKYPISFPFFKRYQPPPAPMMVQAKAKSESAPLARFLHLDILTLVAQHLHYQDLVNLSLSSKEMRETVFPDGHSSGRLGILRIYACDNATKTGCFVCQFPICGSCGDVRRFSRPQLDLLHEETCKPYCSTCFFRKICTRPRFNSRSCDRQITLAGKYHGSRGRFSPDSIENERLVCSSCKPFLIFECLEQRYERGKVKMERKLRHSQYRDDFACKGCSRALSSWGPRWWICDACGSECTDPLHPPWGFKVADTTGHALSKV
ncbi:uncharacterized protein BDCG_01572 [Blastomyces dermatitidis ER-3]|uniref:F-box domain-containing protein n=4 Tax=Ajellomyces dermatitidis TaxID=5039 RepID=F2T7E2_AJEDA|nr:uncharacterized protein BDCG_01572 [Blastomyces dermatitidis ER-3]EGE79155.2 hypothetical protein BDDG_02093 [Blastomyces dermatitidis ATCC 18188]OAS99922.1 hypothetical protein BDCG_01572 [Blastomyces dermatitidis ER-3]